MKKRNLLLVLAVLVVLAVLAAVQWKDITNRGAPPAPPDSGADADKSSSDQGSVNSNELTGILKASDNPEKGNLMLQTSERFIYLHTSRDFSTLLDKEVVVTIEGDSHSFSLIDIKQK